MFFNFTFRHFIAKPSELAQNLQSSTIRGYKIRLIFVIIAGILLFATRSWWGINTEALTTILVTQTTADYTLARIAALFGTIIWSLLFLLFHLFIFAFILSFITYAPGKVFLPLQLIVTLILLVEKGLIFLVFGLKGAVVNVSFLSLGPLAATFMKIPFFIFFFNQLSLTTVLVILLQYKFGRMFIDYGNRKKYLWTLIAIHIGIALMIAAIGEIPAGLMFDELFGGGASHE